VSESRIFSPQAEPVRPLRVFMLGASGTIGQATVAQLAKRGYEVVCFVRPQASRTLPALPGVVLRQGDVTDLQSLKRDGLRDERFDAVVSCMASRTGESADAWAVDYGAHLNMLQAARDAAISRFVLLSAICVQKPLLEFQRAKLAFENALMHSGLGYSIVRPTAFFKSLSGQLARVRAGRPFLIFGDGALTACKPIADDDLAVFLADCVTDPQYLNRVLPVGGPGPAITPREQGLLLFKALGKEPRFRQVPVALLDAIAGLLGLASRVVPVLKNKAELARIGRYYATESMLVLDPTSGRYDAAATPSTGSITLADFYAALARGEAAPQRGDHAVF
jgi:divinyl chlorophyllide a 8-vinyl-reductase